MPASRPKNASAKNMWLVNALEITTTYVFAPSTTAETSQGFCTPPYVLRAVPVLIPSVFATVRRLWPAFRSSATLARLKTAVDDRWPGHEPTH